MQEINKILIIIQRSNGDVFLSLPLIRHLYEYYNSPNIDLLVNDDTIAISELLPFIKKIHTFSYHQKKYNRINQEKNLISKIFKKYDLSINLTSSDRSVLYALLAAKKSISAIEQDKAKSWWKRILLSNYYYFDNSKHILKNNLEPLNLLNIDYENVIKPIEVSEEVTFKIKEKLKSKKIETFLIFHPSAQYRYKIYPKSLRNRLLSSLNQLGIPIVVTGGSNEHDLQIKKQLPALSNVIDFIGETSLEEYFALSELSLGYIGMDTLNMHIAASQNKQIFLISGPTNLKMWSPWSNQLKLSAIEDYPVQTYGNITIFQANMPCVACGKAGCNDLHENSDCLDNISPIDIYKEVSNLFSHFAYKTTIPIQTKSL